jgi:hypothetical protein
MADESVSERIKRRAYELWEAAGRPIGRADEFWEQACVEIGNEILPPDADKGDDDTDPGMRA